MAEQLWSDEELREALAEYAHSAWSGWMRYMFGKGQTRQIDIDGGTQTYWLMPAELFHRWNRQMKTPYAELPEAEKKSDRKEADEILAIVRQVGREPDHTQRAPCCRVCGKRGKVTMTEPLWTDERIENRLDATASVEHENVLYVDYGEVADFIEEVRDDLQAALDAANARIAELEIAVYQLQSIAQQRQKRVEELEKELAEASNRLSGAESAWDTIENLMMGVDDDE